MLYPTHQFVPQTLRWMKGRKCMIRREKFGGRGETRTPDPLLAKQVLCQLSYTPTAEGQSDSKAFPAIPKIESCFFAITVPELSQNPR